MEAVSEEMWVYLINMLEVKVTQSYNMPYVWHSICQINVSFKLHTQFYQHVQGVNVHVHELANYVRGKLSK